MSSSATCLLIFLILLLFRSRRGASADNADPIGTIRMDHDKETLRRRHPHGNGARLFGRVLGVRNRCGEGIAEDGRSLLERNAVVAEIQSRLLRVPLELHPRILRPPPAAAGPFSVGPTLRISGEHRERLMPRVPTSGPTAT